MNGRDGQAVLLGGLVRDRRQACGLTQRELARRAGLSLAAVRDLEQGRTRRPQLRSLSSLAQALDMSLEHIRELAAVPAAGGLCLQVLGPLAVWRSGVPVRLGGASRQAVLGVLALSAGSPVHREAIIDVLWPEHPPANAVNLVQGHVSRLRRMLDPGRTAPGQGQLVSAGASYRLQAKESQLDLLDFGRLARAARKAVLDGDDEAACGAYQQALDLWRGKPLADVDLLRAHPAVTGLAHQRAEAVIGYARVASGAGWHEQVLGLLRDLAGEEPLNEQAHAQLMIAMAGCGQQADALAIYQGICRRLDEQLGIPPGSELSAAYQRVLRQEVAPAPEPRASARSAAPAPIPPAAAAPAATSANMNTGPVVPRQLPAALDLFVGRDAELSALDALLDATAGTVVISAVGGTAGVGKTALAVHWAHRVEEKFADGQLYVNLRGFDPSAAPVPPTAVLGWFLAALGVMADRMPFSMEARSGLYRSLLAGRQVLIVLDNARDADQVRPLLPGSAGCLVLVTSRTRLSGLAVTDGARLLSLDVLSEGEARRMLESRLGRARAVAEPEALGQLIWLCARLPLALAIIAARAAGRTGIALADLAAELADAASRVDILEGGDTVTSLRAVLSWSYRQLSPLAVRMFRLLGLHPGPDIAAPAAASLAGVPVAAARRALEELTAASLLAGQPAGRYGFHDLLRAYARDQAQAAESDQARRAAIGRVLDHFLQTAHTGTLLVQPQRGSLDLEPPLDGVTPEDLTDRQAAQAWFEAEFRVLIAAITLSAQTGFDARTWQLCWVTYDFLLRRGYWRELPACAHIALEAAVRIGDKAGAAWAHRILGDAYSRLGDFRQARAHLARSIRLSRDLADRAGEARAHQNLGHLAERQGRPGELLSHARQALALHQALGNQRGEAHALNTMGWSYLLLGRPWQARAYCERALAMSRKLGLRPYEAASWDSLGYAEFQLGRYDQASACYQGALSLARELGDVFGQAQVLAHLGDACHAAGRLQQARDAWQQALNLFEGLQVPEADEVRDKLRGEAAKPAVKATAT
jgi:DNA-binding SARP family transcriptional activator/tetratricopeptide (TPR) repeat protein/DNA-binding XRE family transcriptional regulator